MSSARLIRRDMLIDLSKICEPFSMSCEGAGRLPHNPISSRTIGPITCSAASKRPGRPNGSANRGKRVVIHSNFGSPRRDVLTGPAPQRAVRFAGEAERNVVEGEGHAFELHREAIGMSR